MFEPARPCCTYRKRRPTTENLVTLPVKCSVLARNKGKVWSFRTEFCHGLAQTVSKLDQTCWFNRHSLNLGENISGLRDLYRQTDVATQSVVIIGALIWVEGRALFIDLYCTSITLVDSL